MSDLFFDQKFGFYRTWLGDVCTRITPSKVEAIEFVKNNGGHMTWHFNDEIFSCYDWKIPVTESVTDFYRERALQLRQKYKKVILMYSGGIDSHNILLTFLKNNIPIDGVGSFYYRHSTEPDDYINYEWEHQTLPRLQKLKEEYPSLDFFRFDNTENCLDMITRHADDWKYLGRGHLNPSTLSMSYLHRFLPQRMQHENSCLIFGMDKPRLRYKDGIFYFNFYDSVFRSTFSHDSKVEFFYWSPDCPKLLIKQAQLVRDYWIANSNKIFTHKGNKNNKDLGILLDPADTGAQHAIYPDCAGNSFISFKDYPNMTLLSRDWWLFRSNTEHAQRVWNLIRRSLESFGSEWFNGNDQTKALTGYITKSYTL